jgi:hypothetical protein
VALTVVGRPKAQSLAQVPGSSIFAALQSGPSTRQHGINRGRSRTPTPEHLAQRAGRNPIASQNKKWTNKSPQKQDTLTPEIVLITAKIEEETERVPAEQLDGQVNTESRLRFQCKDSASWHPTTDEARKYTKHITALKRVYPPTAYGCVRAASAWWIAAHAAKLSQIYL